MAKVYPQYDGGPVACISMADAGEYKVLWFTEGLGERKVDQVRIEEVFASPL